MKTTRRSILQAIVVAVPAIQACSSDAAPPPAPVENGERYFPQSLASGDPRPGSVILWTRVVDDAKPDSDYQVSIEVATDAQFASVVIPRSKLQSLRDHDNALKAKVVGLQPKTTYYYRFLYERDGKVFASKTGRTRTAPAATDDVVVKFAVTTCQDFIGRYYNSWQRLVQVNQDLDFVIFLGDYVYETTGDPTFMSPEGARAVQLTDPGSALMLGSPGAPYAAAQSVSNYRDLYRTVRSDPFLRAAHERYPFVFIWDDHEFSDDCWGDHATYYDGLKDETSLDRRRNAEQAFFEYVPLEHPNVPDGQIDVSLLPRYPDTKIYRDLAFGKHVRLIVADYRTYRPDHLIPEDGYPAKVVMQAGDLVSAGIADSFASDTFAYVDIDADEFSSQKLVLKLAYYRLAMEAGLDQTTASARAEDAVKGPLALAYVNAVLTSPELAIAPIDPAGKPRGLAWVHMGKRDLFTIRGSRYIVLKDTFDAYAAFKYAATSGASENVFGDAQQAWIDTALTSPETWKVLVSSVSLTSLVFDLREKMDVPDPALRNRFNLNADQWDGFPNRRRELLAKMAATANGKAFAVSGDLHASLVSVEQGVGCLTTPAISSETVKEGASGVAKAAGFDESSAVYRYVVTDIDASFIAGNPGIAFSDAASHGFMVVEVHANEVFATFQLIASSQIATDYGARPNELAAQFYQKAFRLTPGKADPI
jgi:alkaline phosphatase D